MESANVSRRKFLHLSGLTGAGLALGIYFPAAAKVATIIKPGDAAGVGVEMNSWIFIDPSGKVTLMCHRAEMGQGVYQSLAQIIAEELEVNLDEVTIQFARGDKKYGSQVTGGSSTVSGSYKNLLKLGATAREMLVSAAAAKWSVPKEECYAEGGNVFHKPSGKKAHYGELAADASKLEPPKEVPLKKTSEYKLIRKPLPRQDMQMKTNGTAVFGLDFSLPGMQYAQVERSPRFNGKVKSFNDAAVLQVPGVKKVFKMKAGVHDRYREGVAVVADSFWAAMQGRKALKVEWDDAGFEHVNTADIYKRQEAALKKGGGIAAKKQGDPDAVLAKAVKKIDLIYQTPYQAHAAMEPLNCVAHYQPDKLEIWGPIQAPDWVQDFVSKEMGLDREKVIVNMTFLGGGFGRKAFIDYPHEAAVISKEIGAPVQVVWTREDDMTRGPFRPGVAYRCEGVVANGVIEAVRISMAGQDLSNWMKPGKKTANWGTTEGFADAYFKSIKNISFTDVPFETPIPPLWWRSVYASTNGFAYESFIDELAVAAAQDPMAFRRKHLDDERCHKLIDKLTEVSGWNTRKKKEGYGVAIVESFGSTVGQVVRVSKPSGGKLKIDKVWAVIDCGWYVNPDTIRAQVEGAIVMALGAATQHEVTFKDGMAVEQNFHTYPITRISETPAIEVHIMDNDANAGGVGEPGLPPFAPALANAIFDLTGKRIRKLPLSLSAL